MKPTILLAAGVAALLLSQPASAQTKEPVSQANQSAIRGPSDASAVGALLEFAYERGAL